LSAAADAAGLCSKRSYRYISAPATWGPFSAVYLEPNGISGRERAAKLGVAASTLNRVLTGASGISPEMALRLSRSLGRSPETWLAMQYSYDLWQARQRVDLSGVAKVRLTAA
jgi:addiction module HigA family antidote